MGDFLELMALPLVAALVIAGIHVYYGLHVVRRGVIFVDLALAQVSAFGATVGLLIGFELHSWQSYFLALGFTMAGAGIFTLTRTREKAVPQEALIGIVYAVSAAAAILVLSRAPEGGEELKAIMVGHLLFVDGGQIVRTAALYAVIAALLWLFREPLITITEDPGRAFEKGLRVSAWDFFFYATFGLVVTNAVQIVGVLLVFAFLIVPAICGIFLAKAAPARLAIGWLTAGLTSVIGIAVSYRWDLPTGATIVCTFIVTLVVCASLRRLIRAPR